MAKSIVELKEVGLNSLVDLLERVQAMTEALNGYFVETNIVNIVIALLGATSAYFMLKRNQLGFHGYIIYNLLASGSIYFFISPSLIPSVILIVNLCISLVFVLLYARHLPWIKGEG
jgi:hypothetical protein